MEDEDEDDAGEVAQIFFTALAEEHSANAARSVYRRWDRPPWKAFRRGFYCQTIEELVSAGDKQELIRR